MGEKKNKSTPDVQNRPLHGVMDTTLGREILKEVHATMLKAANDTGYTTPQWEQVFAHLLYRYFDQICRIWNPVTAGKLPNQDDIDQLFEALIEEVVEPDIAHSPEANNDIQEIAKASGHIHIWTNGDTSNQPQAAAILRLRINELAHITLAGINRKPERETIFPEEKNDTIFDSLNLLTRTTNASEIMIGIIDDNPGSIASAATEINRWLAQKTVHEQPIKILIVPIRIKSGRHRDDPWPASFPYCTTEAANLAEAASILEQRGQFAQIPKQQRITFLDANDTLPDTQVNNLRQAQALHMQVATTMTKVLERRVGENVLTNRKQLNHGLFYKNVLSANHPELSKIFEAVNSRIKTPLTEDTMGALLLIDSWLQITGFMDPNMTADDVKKAYEALAANNPGSKPDCLFNGQANYSDPNDSQPPPNDLKIGEENPHVVRLFSAEERKKAKQLERAFADELETRFAIPGQISLNRGPMKTMTSLYNNAGDKEAHEVADLVRGRLEVDGNMEASSFEELNRVAMAIVTSDLAGDIVRFKNYFELPEGNGRHESLIQGFKVVFRVGTHGRYELQLQTKFAAAVGKLNHDTIYKPNVPLTEEQKDHIRKLTWAAHIMDLENSLNHGPDSLTKTGIQPSAHFIMDCSDDKSWSA